jgi:fimbrial chaperone protein
MSPVHLAVLAFRSSGTPIALALGVLVSSVAAPAAYAGVFSVVPVRIYMTPRDRAVPITVVNEGDTPMVLQAEVSTWRQKADGSDEQVPSDDLILSPPIIKLAPKARQVVRLARVSPVDLGQQLTYRLVIREVPEATAQRDRAIQIPIALALSMPVFITPPAAKRTVACEAARGPEASVQVSCANSGNAYAQVREVQVRRGIDVMGRLEGGFYILPGARKALSVPSPQPVVAGPAQLHVSFDDGLTQTYDVVIP